MVYEIRLTGPGTTASSNRQDTTRTRPIRPVRSGQIRVRLSRLRGSRAAGRVSQSLTGTSEARPSPGARRPRRRSEVEKWGFRLRRRNGTPPSCQPPGLGLGVRAPEEHGRAQHRDGPPPTTTKPGGGWAGGSIAGAGGPRGGSRGRLDT